MFSEIWVEKYRPKKIEDVIAEENIINKLNEYIEKKDIPHLLFSGSAGIGKTTVAKILANSITEEIMYINASDKTSIDVIRDQVSRFCATMSFSGELKIIILDEFDGISPQAQKMLRGVTEEFHKTCRFILTCNFENVILDAIHSRFQKIDFGESNLDILKHVAIRCKHILKEEGIPTKDVNDAIKDLVRKFFPDIRKIINTLQQCCVNGKFVYSDNKAVSEEIDLLISYLNKGNIKAIRKELLGAGADYKKFYRALFDRTDEYTSNENKLGAMLIIGEYMNLHSNTIDPEINFVTCLLQVCRL